MRATQIVGLCLGLALLAGCPRPARPQFQTLDRVQFAGVDLAAGTVLLTANAVFHNPNGIGLEVTALELKVLLDGTQAATVEHGATATGAAHADFAVPLRFEIPLKIVTDALRDEGGSLLGGLLGGKEVDVQVDGWVRVKLGGIQMKTPLHHRERVAVKL